MQVGTPQPLAPKHPCAKTQWEHIVKCCDFDQHGGKRVSLGDTRAESAEVITSSWAPTLGSPELQPWPYSPELQPWPYTHLTCVLELEYSLTAKMMTLKKQSLKQNGNWFLFHTDIQSGTVAQLQEVTHPRLFLPSCSAHSRRPTSSIWSRMAPHHKSCCVEMQLNRGANNRVSQGPGPLLAWLPSPLDVGCILPSRAQDGLGGCRLHVLIPLCSPSAFQMSTGSPGHDPQ